MKFKFVKLNVWGYALKADLNDELITQFVIEMILQIYTIFILEPVCDIYLQLDQFQQELSDPQ